MTKIESTKTDQNQEYNSREKEIQKVSREFESLFMDLVLQAMRKTLDTPSLFGKSNAEGIYRSMLDQEYSKEMANSGQVGLSKLISQQMLGVQDKQNIAKYRNDLAVSGAEDFSVKIRK